MFQVSCLFEHFLLIIKMIFFSTVLLRKATSEGGVLIFVSGNTQKCRKQNESR